MLLPHTSTFRYNDLGYYAFNAGIAVCAGVLGGIKSGAVGAVLGVSIWTITAVTRPIFDLVLHKLKLHKLEKHGLSFPPALVAGLLTGPFITQGITMIFGSSFRATKFICSAYSFKAIQAVAIRHFDVIGLVLLAGAGVIGWTARAYFQQHQPKKLSSDLIS